MLCSSGVSAGLLLLVATLSTCLFTPIKAIFTLISHVTSRTSPSCFKAEADLTDSRKGIGYIWQVQLWDHANVGGVRPVMVRPACLRSVARRSGRGLQPAAPALATTPARPAPHSTIHTQSARSCGHRRILTPAVTCHVMCDAVRPDRNCLIRLSQIKDKMTDSWTVTESVRCSSEVKIGNSYL